MLKNQLQQSLYSGHGDPHIFLLRPPLPRVGREAPARWLWPFFTRTCMESIQARAPPLDSVGPRLIPRQLSGPAAWIYELLSAPNSSGRSSPAMERHWSPRAPPWSPADLLSSSELGHGAIDWPQPAGERERETRGRERRRDALGGERNARDAREKIKGKKKLMGGFYYHKRVELRYKGCC